MEIQVICEFIKFAKFASVMGLKCSKKDGFFGDFTLFYFNETSFKPESGTPRKLAFARFRKSREFGVEPKLKFLFPEQ